MSLQIEGSIKKSFPEESGEGKNGKWRKQDFLIVYDDKYPKELLLTAWGDTISSMLNVIDRRAKFSIEPSSNPGTNGRYYTNTKVWRVS